MAPPLAKRYFFKLLANIFSVPVYLIMEAILPRALGPQLYGNFNFSTALFLQFTGFLDMGSSTCLYNFLSRNCVQTSLVSFYLRIAAIVSLMVILTGFLALWPPVGIRLLPDMPLWLGPMAGIWALLTWLGRVFRSTNDALGATVPSEIWRTSLSVLAVITLLALYFTSTLNLVTLFLQQYLFLFLTALAFWHVSCKYWRKESCQFNFFISATTKKAYIRKFFDYSHPLFVQSLISFFMLATERWLLQWFDGSTQQGYYALSQKVSMACFLFVSAMTPLLMRELSVAWGNMNVKKMGELIGRFAPLLYALAAYFSCFTMVEAAAMVEIFGGNEFTAAIIPVQIMALYPLHQAYGQMATSVFHASGKTKILRNITAVECCYGMVLTWFLIAPSHFWGLNLGATGLALKTVMVQILTVNIYLWLASRFVPFNFWHNLGHQIWCVIVFTLLAYTCQNLSFSIDPDFNSPLWRFFISGIWYSALALITVIMSPKLIGLTRREVWEFCIRFKNAIKYTK